MNCIVKLYKHGGEGGIRTLDTLPYTHFPGVRLRPLGHLSAKARRVNQLAAISNLNLGCF